MLSDVRDFTTRPMRLERLLLAAVSSKTAIPVVRFTDVHLDWDLPGLRHPRSSLRFLRGGRWIVGLGRNQVSAILCCWDLRQNVAGQDLHPVASYSYGAFHWNNPMTLGVQYRGTGAVDCLIKFLNSTSE